MPQPKRKIASSEPMTVHQLKITLKYTEPPIWRRVLVTSETSLAELHDVIQIAMGWDNDHLHEFDIARQHYGDAQMVADMGWRDETQVTLNQVVPNRRTKFKYQYDFGDSWDHELLVEKVLPPEPDAKYPVCLGGERACPPEDCGGVWGYERYLELMKTPDDPEYEEAMEWIGESFDPEAFDIAATNAKLWMFL